MFFRTMESNEIAIKDEPLDDSEYSEYDANSINEILVCDPSQPLPEIKTEFRAEMEEPYHQYLEEQDPLAIDNNVQIIDDNASYNKASTRINIDQSTIKDSEFKVHTTFDIRPVVNKANISKPSNHYQYRCNVCRKRFKLKISLDIHTKFSMCKISKMPHSVESIKQLAGDEKLQPLQTKLELQRHMENSTDNGKVYVCRCDLKFNNDNAFIRHYGNCTKPGKLDKRPQEKYDINFLWNLLFCEKCRCRCPSVHAFTQHMTQKHNESKPFMCDLCQKKFETIAKHQAHNKTAHAIKSKSKYICHICDKEFTTYLLITQHMQMHT